MSLTKKMRRCPNGTRRNKKTGNCDPIPILDDNQINVEPSAKTLSEPQPPLESLSVTNITGEDYETRAIPTIPSPSPLGAPLPSIVEKPSVLGDAKSIRCPKGTRRNKKTGLCEPLRKVEVDILPEPTETTPIKLLPSPSKTRKRCPSGQRRNPKTGMCEPLGPKPETAKEKAIVDSSELPQPQQPQPQPQPLVPLPLDLVTATVRPSVAARVVREEPQVMSANNKELYMREKAEYEEERASPNKEYSFLYPHLNDPEFNAKIADRKEFYDTQYDGDISVGIREKANRMCNAKFELMPHQLFVRNFLSFQTPYNGLLLYHGLGSGKTCSAIGIAEEMRAYMKQVGIRQQIIVVASPNVQGNFRLQLFDDRKLKKIPNPIQSQGLMGTEEDIWDIHSCVGNSLLKEINPANLKGLSRDKVVSQINAIINTYYKFMGYGQFANYIQNRIAGDNTGAREIRNIRRAFNHRLVIIDEVHNIRLTDDNTNNKKTASLLMKVAKYSENMRLLLLSATPMFNSYKEIIWITNLLNMNDKRATIDTSSVFDRDGSFKQGDEKGLVESGDALLRRKLTGYVSYVRGENPFIFPYRIYPHLFSPENTFMAATYPTKQMNGAVIDEPIKHIRVFLNTCGETYQEKVYNAIIENMRRRDYSYETVYGNIRELPSFENMESFGYTLLQTPIEALNMTYPNAEIDASIQERAVTGNTDISLAADTIAKCVGNAGLLNVMDFDDDMKTIIAKHNFKYKATTEASYGRIFSPAIISQYSAKIATICNIIKKSTGIIVVYSQYIHGGIIPFALALEEMGFSRYSSTPSHNKNLFQTRAAPVVDAMTFRSDEVANPAKYMLITGDKSYSPSNSADIKYATQEDNKYGEKVKVILVSKAGSEGLDFKNVRQVHILEPWYNMNRIEQIIGRGVRNLSHCALPFEERNVEVYLHSTLLSKNAEEEAADLYVYRFAEKKAMQIGRVSRLLKESSVDCILNIGQTNFTAAKLASIVENTNIEMRLSSGKTIMFRVGDEPYSSMCDYMETCEYKCIPDKTGDGVNVDTYNEYYAKTNNEYIIRRIGELFRENTFYKRDTLIREINRIRAYPLVQIFQALTYLINTKTEYLVDKYGRIGNLVNRGEYYVFQPIEISDTQISVFERSAPVPYKPRDIVFEVPNTFRKVDTTMKDTSDAADKDTGKHTIADAAKMLFEKMAANYEIVFSPTKLKLGAGEKNWYKHANQVVDMIAAEHSIPRAKIEEYVVYHMLDLTHFAEKTILLSFIIEEKRRTTQVKDGMSGVAETVILPFCKRYFDKHIMVGRDGKYAAFLTKDNVSKIYLYDSNNDTAETAASGAWVEADAEDYKEYEELIARSVVPKSKINEDIVGFINMFKGKDMVFKIKDMRQKRNNVGARCGDSTIKSDVVKALNTLTKTDELYETTIHIGLCVLIEMLLRWYSETERDGKIYFFDAEQTYVNNIVKG